MKIFWVGLLLVWMGAGWGGAKDRIERLVIPPGASEALWATAEDLADVVGLREGKRPEIVQSRWRFPKNALYLGNTPITILSIRLPGDLSFHGSVVHRGRNGRIFLRARSEEAVLHGAYTFAQREWGARWFLPHEDQVFLVTPEPVERVALGERELLEPQFWHRNLHGLRTKTDAFARRNRLSRLYEMNHALAHIFTPELFDQRPELFSTIDGRRERPKKSHDFDPNPHLAAVEAAEYAAGAVLDYFAAHPEAESISLGINDNILFDDTELTRELVEPLRYFRGLPNHSDLVFLFMNRVAELVFDGGGAWQTPSGRPRYLSALAYYWAEAVPSFPVHPRVMPILTADRAQWHDPEFRAEDEALIEAWSRSGVDTIATWDYTFGSPYPYPRQITDNIVASIRHLAAHGSRVYFSQFGYRFAYDGAKAYVTAQLLWEPEADPERLLTEFYQGVFGPAAETMRSFYEGFEAERNRREGTANWIKFYLDEASIELFTLPFLLEKQDLLARAAAEVEGQEASSARVAEVRRDFAFTVDYARFQQTRRQLFGALSAGSDGEFLLVALAEYLSQRRTLLEVYDAHPTLQSLGVGGQSEPTGAAIGALAERITDPGQWARLLRLVPEWEASLQAVRGLREEPEAYDLEPVTPNPFLLHEEEPPEPRFLFPPEMPEVGGWQFVLRPAERTTITDLVPSFGFGLVFREVDSAAFLTSGWAEPGQVYLVEGNFRFRGSPDNRTVLEVTWLDETGKRLRRDRVVKFPVEWDDSAPVEGRSFSCRIPLLSPEGAAQVSMGVMISRQYPGDVLEISRMSLSKIVPLQR